MPNAHPVTPVCAALSTVCVCPQELELASRARIASESAAAQQKLQHAVAAQEEALAELALQQATEELRHQAAMAEIEQERAAKEASIVGHAPALGFRYTTCMPVTWVVRWPSEQA